MYQFKVKDSEIKPYLLCLDNTSQNVKINNMKKITHILKKVGHTSEFLSDIYWWTWKTIIKKTVEVGQ